jgi:NADPH:quinone reductase-like Zn-dependent oxidoreductase
VWDADIRKGWWPKGRPKFPLILGSDGAGIVVAKGSRVRRFDVGDRVSDHLVDDLRALAPRGVDGILALAGGAPLDQCVGLVKRGGRVAFPNGIEAEPNRKQGVRLLAYDAEATPRHLATLRVAVEKARLRVLIAAAFPLARAAKAHETLERGHVLGRLVLKIPQVRAVGESKLAPRGAQNPS